MSTKVEKRLLVNVPVGTAYNQWTQFEEFPQFMGGVKSVKQLSDDRLEWVAEIAGVRRQWVAKILEQVPDRKVVWAATEGATNAGSVEFEDVGGGQTSLQLTLEYDPEGFIEKVGDKLHVVDRQAEADLKKFKAFIEHEGYATGAWRGSVNGEAPATDPSTPAEPVTVTPIPDEPGSTGTTAAGASANPLAERSDDRTGHPFDQTNGLVDVEGESKRRKVRPAAPLSAARLPEPFHRWEGTRASTDQVPAVGCYGLQAPPARLLPDAGGACVWCARTGRPARRATAPGKSSQGLVPGLRRR